MTEPVKTTLLKALEKALGTISGLPTVWREYDLPFDLEATDPETGMEIIDKPALFFWQDSEDEEEDNLITRKTLHLQFAVYLKLPTDDVPEYQPQGGVILKEVPVFQRFSDRADILAGKIHALMNNRVNLAAWQALGLLEIEPVAQSKALASETYGEMVLTYRLTYWHRLGDAYSLNLQ